MISAAAVSLVYYLSQWWCHQQVVIEIGFSFSFFSLTETSPTVLFDHREVGCVGVSIGGKYFHEFLRFHSAFASWRTVAHWLCSRPHYFSFFVFPFRFIYEKICVSFSLAVWSSLPCWVLLSSFFSFVVFVTFFNFLVDEAWAIQFYTWVNNLVFSF